MMSWTVIGALAIACGTMMIVERTGARTTLSLDFKGDVKRETRWLAQYGQLVCTTIAALLVWQIDRARPQAWLALLTAVFGASIACMVIKRALGRVRPARENAGKFLGFTWTHANYRESFPSSHSACAVALSVALAQLYPPAAITFWALALTCAALRYVLDAHWPSDVLGGIALGGACANLVCSAFNLGP